MPNIIFKLNNAEKIKITQEEFEALNFSEMITGQANTFIDLGLQGFQKYSLVSWGPEEVEEVEEDPTQEGPIQ